MLKGPILQFHNYHCRHCQGLYDAIIPEAHLLQRIKENIDFSFVNPMLRKQYCENFGRPAKEPEMMFKLFFLKKLYDLSERSSELAARRRTWHINFSLIWNRKQK